MIERCKIPFSFHKTSSLDEKRFPPSHISNQGTKSSQIVDLSFIYCHMTPQITILVSLKLQQTLLCYCHANSLLVNSVRKRGTYLADKFFTAKSLKNILDTFCGDFDNMRNFPRLDSARSSFTTSWISSTTSSVDTSGWAGLDDLHQGQVFGHV